MPGRKQGELEAITILESIGIQVDRDYLDDNSHKSMPDVRCKDGRYIEVTHTHHNNAIFSRISKFDQIQNGESFGDSIRRRLEVEIECSDALDRVHKFNYEKEFVGRSSPEGLTQFMRDAKLLKEHLGYDVIEMDFAKQHSEFKCDRPTIHFSTDNILREITKDKGKKYPDGDVDLFVFATDEEFRLMEELIPQWRWNGTASGFLNQILKSPFLKIYVCEWCFERQEYNTDNPQLIVFCKYEEGLKWECHNLRSAEETEMIT